MVCISAQTALGFNISYVRHPQNHGILALKFRGDPSAEAVGKVGLREYISDKSHCLSRLGKYAKCFGIDNKVNAMLEVAL